MTFVIGTQIGFIWDDFPGISFKKEIGLSDIINSSLAVLIAFAIPIMVTKRLDDKKIVKNEIIVGAKEIINRIADIKIIFKDNLDSDGALLLAKEKRNILLILHEIEIQISSLTKECDMSFRSNSKQIIKLIEDSYLSYKRFLTGGPFMNPNFQINETNYKIYCINQGALYTKLRIAIHKITEI